MKPENYYALSHVILDIHTNSGEDLDAHIQRIPQNAVEGYTGGSKIIFETGAAVYVRIKSEKRDLVKHTTLGSSSKRMPQFYN